VLRGSAVIRRISGAGVDGHNTVEASRCRHSSALHDSLAQTAGRGFLGGKHREKMRSAVALVGEADGLEAVTRWFAAVTDTFIQSARNPVQAFVQLLPNVPIVLMGQEQDRGVSQVLHSGEQFVCHPSTPRVNAVRVCRRGLEIVQPAVRPQHGFGGGLKIINPHIIWREQAQEVAQGLLNPLAHCYSLVHGVLLAFFVVW